LAAEYGGDARQEIDGKALALMSRNVVSCFDDPRLLFPFVRAVIANATREGGFPPLLIHPIDFAEPCTESSIAETE
jgi:preprotein translocase subunit SecB